MKCKYYIYILLCTLFAFSSCSCKKMPQPLDPAKRKVFIYYGAAYNNLASNIKSDIDDICRNVPAYTGDDRFKVLIFCHSTAGDYDYSKPNSPVLMDVYRNEAGAVIRDTVKIFSPSTVSVNVNTIKTVLSYIKDTYPAGEYGLVFSSHATGWLPSMYTADYEDDTWELSFDSTRKKVQRNSPVNAGTSDRGRQLRMYPYALTRSVGSQFANVPSRGSVSQFEMDIKDFAAAIPMHLSYLLFDACLMGGVEVAYELRNVTDRIAFSPMEIMADGFIYERILNHLFASSGPDVQAVCEDVFEYYKTKSPWPYCTISFIDCTQLETLAGTCRNIFAKYRTELANVNPNKVQRYWQYGWHWFYDLEDILVNAGISTDDHNLLLQALGDCVVYEDATPKGVLNSFDIVTHCGLSMFLPCHSSKGLPEYYKGLQWNRATSLVE